MLSMIKNGIIKFKEKVKMIDNKNILTTNNAEYDDNLKSF